MLVFLLIGTCGAIFLFGGSDVVPIAIASLLFGAASFYGLLRLQIALQRAK